MYDVNGDGTIEPKEMTEIIGVSIFQDYSRKLYGIRFNHEFTSPIIYFRRCAWIFFQIVLSFVCYVYVSKVSTPVVDLSLGEVGGLIKEFHQSGLYFY